MKNIPQHVAIIMDGNRRWARKRHMPHIVGHREGTKRIEPLVEHAAKKGITHLTFWAFSTENWKRSQEEVGFLLQVFREAMKDPMVGRLNEKGVRVNIIGDITAFPQDIQENVEKIISDSKNNTKIIANFALNYGGRAEILRAVKNIMKDQPNDITEEMFTRYLYTVGQPDPDLLIRTGGEQRLSGYLSWQSIYSELYFTATLWPDFDTDAFDQALEEYATRQRRFGT